MTLNQLNILNEQELAMILYVVNVISPPESPKMEFEKRHLVWFKHDQLVKKMVDAFPKLLPEGYPIYLTLMNKLGVKGEIKYPHPPLPVTESTQNTGSI
jgi:hypothetical protein